MPVVPQRGSMPACRKADFSRPDPPSTRDRILDAAERRFAERGFSGAAMRDIAASVGLNPASLYNYFTSKRALYETVLDRGFRPISELLDSLAGTAWTPESLDAETDRLMERLAKRPQLARLIVHEALAGGEHLTRLSRDWLRPLYARALATLRQSGAMRNWPEEELPLLLMAFHHLILGHFAVAPMLREVFDEDPLTPGVVERQGRFMRRIVRILLVENPPPRGG
jgi:AcrR family transcriptional regulator